MQLNCKSKTINYRATCDSLPNPCFCATLALHTVCCEAQVHFYHSFCSYLSLILRQTKEEICKREGQRHLKHNQPLPNSFVKEFIGSFLCEILRSRLGACSIGTAIMKILCLSHYSPTSQMEITSLCY